MVAIMSQRRNWTRTLLFWTPRVLTILFALFMSLFALDVFTSGAGVWETAIALSVHLIPAAVILLLLVAAWRREWVGAVGYISLSVLYLLTAWERLHWSASAAIAGPLFLIGVMFLIGWLYRSEVRALR